MTAYMNKKNHHIHFSLAYPTLINNIKYIEHRNIKIAHGNMRLETVSGEGYI